MIELGDIMLCFYYYKYNISLNYLFIIKLTNCVNIDSVVCVAGLRSTGMSCSSCRQQNKTYQK